MPFLELYLPSPTAATLDCNTRVRKQKLWSATENSGRQKTKNSGLQLRSATQESGNKTNLITLSVKKLKCG